MPPAKKTGATGPVGPAAQVHPDGRPPEKWMHWSTPQPGPPKPKPDIGGGSSGGAKIAVGARGALLESLEARHKETNLFDGMARARWTQKEL